MTVNKAILVGNLGADPESRTAASGTVVTNLRIATTERQKDQDGNWNDHTEWHRVVCFGKTAENVARFLQNGRQVYIEGRIQTRKWQDKDGADRWSTEVVAREVRFLGSKDTGGQGERGGYQNDTRGGQGGGRRSGGQDDDIPF